jgi:hypothetical protein
MPGDAFHLLQRPVSTETKDSETKAVKMVKGTQCSSQEKDVELKDK